MTCQLMAHERPIQAKEHWHGPDLTVRGLLQQTKRPLPRNLLGASLVTILLKGLVSAVFCQALQNKGHVRLA